MTTATNKTLTNIIYDLFVKTGFPINSIKYSVAQALHETGNKIDQPHEIDGKNWSGITYINNKLLQKNAKRGNLKPKEDWSNPNIPEYYAWFETVEDWARDFKRLVSRNNGLKGKPIEATTLQDYVARLKANHYFGDTEKNYFSSLTFWLEKVKKTIQDNAAKTVVLLIIALALINY